MTTQRPSKPADMAWLVPCLTIADLSKAIDFYVSAFGFERCPGEEALHEGAIVHALMKYKGQVVFMLGAEHAFGSHVLTPKHSQQELPSTLYVYVDDVDAWHQQAKSKGAEILDPPETMFWGDRVCRVKDLDGYHWMFATNVTEEKPMPSDFAC